MDGPHSRYARVAVSAIPQSDQERRGFVPHGAAATLLLSGPERGAPSRLLEEKEDVELLAFDDVEGEQREGETESKDVAANVQLNPLLAV